MFENVCLQPSSDRQHLTAWLIGAAHCQHSEEQHAALLQQHLQHALQEEFSTVHCKAAAGSVEKAAVQSSPDSSAKTVARGSSNASLPAISKSRSRSISAAVNLGSMGSRTADVQLVQPFDASAFHMEPAVTMLWSTVRENQGSFGHGEKQAAAARMLACMHAMHGTACSMACLLAYAWTLAEAWTGAACGCCCCVRSGELAAVCMFLQAVWPCLLAPACSNAVGQQRCSD
jgi:hypothetical protein